MKLMDAIFAARRHSCPNGVILNNDKPLSREIGFVCSECGTSWMCSLVGVKQDLSKFPQLIAERVMTMQGRLKLAATLNSYAVLVWDEELA